MRATSRRSPARCALRADVERVKRLARRHEQTVALEPAEADVGAALGELDAADELAGGRIDHHAGEVLAAHSPAAPHGAGAVDAETLGGGRPGGADGGARGR